MSEQPNEKISKVLRDHNKKVYKASQEIFESRQLPKKDAARVLRNNSKKLQETVKVLNDVADVLEEG